MGNNFDALKFYSMFRNAAINSAAEAEWSEYRRRTTDFIIKNAEEGSTLAIYGAGRCNDLDIKRLGRYFSELVLLDWDSESMKKAVQDCEDIVPEHVSFRSIDFVGIEEEYYLRFINYFHDNIRFLKNAGDYSDFREQLLEIVRDAYFSVKDYYFTTERKTDYSVMLGLHSQLNNSFSGIWNYVLASVAGMPGDNSEMYSEFCNVLTEIEKLQSIGNTEIVRRVNDSVLTGTGKGIFLGYEICLSDMKDSLIEGAYQASQDFEKRERSGQLKTMDYSQLVWPLDIKRKIVYDVMLGFWEKKG